jgi:hypothetical protein
VYRVPWEPDMSACLAEQEMLVLFECTALLSLHWPLSGVSLCDGLRIGATGGRVVVSSGTIQWGVLALTCRERYCWSIPHCALVVY